MSLVRVSTLIFISKSLIGFIKFLFTSAANAFRGEIYKVCSCVKEALLIKSIIAGMNPANVFPLPVGEFNITLLPLFISLKVLI